MAFIEPMLNPSDVQLAILGRCSELGLWPSQAQQIAQSLKLPLTDVIGLDPRTFTPLPDTPWIWLATYAVSLDLSERIPQEVLLNALSGSRIPHHFDQHIERFLDVAPLHIVVMTIAQASQILGISSFEIWRHINYLADTRGIGQRLKISTL